jgi:hypothetical protein
MSGGSMRLDEKEEKESIWDNLTSGFIWQASWRLRAR